MNKQLAFYMDVLGLKLVWPKTPALAAKEGWAELEIGGVSICLHAGGRGKIGPDASTLVFKVSDIRVAAEALQARNKRQKIKEAIPGLWILETKDPEGNNISFESSKNSLT